MCSAQACPCLPAVALIIGAGHRFGAGVARQWLIEGAKAVIAPVYNEEERVRHCLTHTCTSRKQVCLCWMTFMCWMTFNTTTSSTFIHNERPWVRQTP